MKQVLLCGALIVTVSMGIRHGFGLWLQPITMERGWTRETFAFAMAVQNLAWGAAGPIAGMLADQLFYGRTMQFTAELDAKYAALTVDQVNAAIRTYFKPDALSVSLAGDFAGKAGAAATAAPTK